MHLILAHPAIALAAGYIALNCLVAGMPAPAANSGLGYRWLYGSLNALALNIRELARAHYPQVPLPPSLALERPTP